MTIVAVGNAVAVTIPAAAIERPTSAVLDPLVRAIAIADAVPNPHAPDPDMVMATPVPVPGHPNVAVTRRGIVMAVLPGAVDLRGLTAAMAGSEISGAVGEALAVRQVLAALGLTGKPVRALCGKKWTPGRDPEKFPICPDCQKIYEKMMESAGDLVDH